MSKNPLQNILKSSLGMSFATLLSRILGLVRTILEAAVFGGQGVAAIWSYAIIFPNIFRRILGEGALGTALIPLISGAESEEEKREIRRKLGLIYTVAGGILVLVVIVVSVFAICCGDMFKEQYVKDAFKLVPFLMPYAFFICLIGIGGACLSTKKVFFLPALAGLMLNVFIIGTLMFFYYRNTSNMNYVMHKLSYAVLLSGVLQLGFICVLMKKHGIFPEFDLQYFKEHTQVLRELWKLVLPGIIAGSTLQLSVALDKSIALLLGKDVLPSLAYTERIVYLPVGVFALSVGSVLMADMSRSAAAGKYDEVLSALQFSLRHVIFCCIPMSAFVVFFRTWIIEALFLRGRFTMADVDSTAWAMLFYCAGIPFFCSLKVITPAFFARKDMKTPMKISIIALIFNLIMNLVLMIPLKQGGLALATVLSSVLNNVVLLFLLHRSGFKLNWRELGKTITKTFSASAAAVAAGLFAIPYLMQLPSNAGGKFVGIMILLCIFGVVYLIAAYVVRTAELREFMSLLNRRGKRN